MIVKLALVNGVIQVFKREDYMVSNIKEMHPAILKVEVYNEGGKRIVKRQRHFKWVYEKFIYKPLPESEQKEKEQDGAQNVENKTE